MGWDQVHMTPDGAADPLLAGFAEGANMFFTHSYAVADDADAADVLGAHAYTQSSRASRVMATCQVGFFIREILGPGTAHFLRIVNIVEEVGR